MMFALNDYELIFWLVFLLFTVVTLVQLLYFWGIFSRLAFFNKQDKVYDKQPVSVVICARNDYNNLRRNLPMFLEQDYPQFEVVVVNDGSDDETSYLLKSLAETYPHLSIVTIKENLNFFSGKKFPLSIGIKSAKYDVLLLTDADCRPASPLWIRLMQSNFVEKKEIVLGYGGYETRPGFLNKLIRYDAMFIAIQYLSFALARMPYMGVGRNLSYRKSLFYKTKGFISHYRIRSGDDDLFINSVASGKNTRIEISHESHTVSIPKTNFSEWVRQKHRHFSTGKLYKPRHKIMLSLYPLSLFLFYMLFFLLLSSMYNIYYVLALFGLRMFSALFIHKKCMSKLAEENLLLYLPIFELFFIFFNPILSLTASISRQHKWK
jgi:glycosyltransferase involved in cell wall biosynthesis